MSPRLRTGGWVALDRAVELAGSIGSNADRVSR